jgi:translation initiation factor IF-2
MVFVVDTVRCASSPNTFMSNMLYACSMYYRTRLPLVICFNKTDVVSHEFCMEWMKDFEAFQDALDNARNEGNINGGESGFYDSLTRSLSLVLDEFYTEFSKNAVGVSAVTGDGIDDFWKVIKNAANTDFSEYIEDLKHRIEEQDAKRKAMARVQARKLQRDVDNDNSPY